VTLQSAPTTVALDALLKNESDLAFRRRVPLVVGYLDPRTGDRILDCGCGMGFSLRVLDQLYDCRLFGVERNPATLRRARSALDRNVGLARADAVHLPFPDAAFDKVLMTEVLEHIPDEQAALREIRRVLRPGGTYVLSVPNANYPFWWDPINKSLEIVLHTHFPSHIWWLAGIWADHQRLYTTDGIRSALGRAEFEVEDVQPFTHYCLPFHQQLVYGIGKNLLQKGLLPESLARSADRFRSDENRGSPFNPMNLALRLLRWIDRHNDGLTDTRLSYVDIAVRARKPG
jgi:ubiquinone/menaquinone biosynthesis C-methylase UbiE